MQRRTFTAGLALAATGAAWAQGPAPAEGRHYIRLSQPLPPSLLPAGQVDVSEFFWYECPHCNSFEPLLDPWVRRQPASVAFRRVPVGFTARHQVAQKLYYALEEMGQLDSAHRRIFAAIHGQGQRLTSDNDAIALASAAGVDRERFVAAYRSFPVSTKAARARQLSDAYKVDSVPMLGIGGRYFTSAALAGGHDKVLLVADYLVRQSSR